MIEPGFLGLFELYGNAIEPLRREEHKIEQSLRVTSCPVCLCGSKKAAKSFAVQVCDPEFRRYHSSSGQAARMLRDDSNDWTIKKLLKIESSTRLEAL